MRAGADRVVVEGVVDLPRRPPGPRARGRGRGRRRATAWCWCARSPPTAAPGPTSAAAPPRWGCSPSSPSTSSPCTARPTSGGCAAPTSTARCSTGSAAATSPTRSPTYRALHAELTTAEAELAHLRTAAAERAREADALRVGLERIEALDPQPGEDTTLGIESQRLGHAEELRAGAGAAHTALSGDDDAGMPSPGVLEALATASSRLASVSGSDPALAEIGTRVDELRYLAADVAADLGSYLADADIDPARLEQVEQRRAALGELTRLYGPTVDDVLRWGGEAARRVGELDGTGDRIGELEARVVDLTAAREEAAGRLTAARSTAAAALGARITDELSHLAMGSATVSVAVEDAGRFTADGRDDIEIRLASGSGTAPRAVTKAASGGELSRVMLAIEVATATEVTSVPTFVFDEVDAGVGGRAALDVGARLAALARHAQVVVVTHLAQVAAHADRHLVVERSDDGHVTRSGVHEVEGEQRVAELARMLGGSGTEAALEHARDLMARARA